MSHVLFFVTEPGLPKEALALGFAAHLAYGWLFQTFPMLKVLSPSFLASIAARIFGTLRMTSLTFEWQ